MGTDLHGLIEVRAAPEFTSWAAVGDLAKILGHTRDYDLFGCLFGVRNYANFAPLFAGRGLPHDLSAGGKAALVDEFAEPDDPDWWHSETWCTFAELSRIDRSASARSHDQRVHEFEIVDGKEVWRRKASWSARFVADRVGNELHLADRAQVGNRVYRRVVMTRREIIPRLAPAMDFMRPLANEHGADNVRLVAWFDS